MMQKSKIFWKNFEESTKKIRDVLQNNHGNFEESIKKIKNVLPNTYGCPEPFIGIMVKESLPSTGVSNNLWNALRQPPKMII